MEISVKEARSRFSSLLDQVEDGEEVVIRRRGKEVARLVPPRGEGRRFPSLKEFRAAIRKKGEPLSGVVKRGRIEERY
jgi:prevent-host-death family protein